MFPHERSLVKRMENTPFPLIGVNRDKSKDVIKEKNEKQKITWRSFWNGTAGTGGPISKEWRVKAWPTLFLIDHEGVIRRRWVGSPGDTVLDEAIDELVAKVSKR